ncbi:hypothetical protein A0H81_02377 [Grifola frondosa]|uniref:Uncharacterized protein n=1 Tax=Grifola frondosa TaxID=5627 RepID=A0A1C7MKU6_GRIFR|nr:hypothetical protein A0H81_02377 [Grifola frondosa]
MQLVEEVTRADGITISGDGTTHKHVNYESRNVYLNTADSHTRRFLGVHAAPNHTSEKQLDGWKKIIEDLYETYNSSPHGMEFPADKREFARKVRGMTTDHAEDQKKLQRLVEEWKRACDREICGEKAMLSMAPETLIPLLVVVMSLHGQLKKWVGWRHGLRCQSMSKTPETKRS